MCTMSINSALSGIELTFAGKPADEIREAMKEAGFRWHRQKKLWYAKSTPARLALAEKLSGQEPSGTAQAPEQASKKTSHQNAFGVKVGDIFLASWGYEQTNNTFLQVIALAGKTSVRVREVQLPIVDSRPVSGMSEDRIYKIVNEILPPTSTSVFIKDQENGDLKRLKPGYYQDKEKAKQKCFFCLSSFANAYRCTGGTVEAVYESWYY